MRMLERLGPIVRQGADNTLAIFVVAGDIDYRQRVQRCTRDLVIKHLIIVLVSALDEVTYLHVTIGVRMALCHLKPLCSVQTVMHITKDEHLHRVGLFGIRPIEARELKAWYTVLTKRREDVLNGVSCPDGFRRIVKPRIPADGTEHYATR